MIRIFVRLGSTMREIEIKIVGFIKTQKGLLSSGLVSKVFFFQGNNIFVQHLGVDGNDFPASASNHHHSFQALR